MELDETQTTTTPVVVQQQNFDTGQLAPALNTIITESKKGYRTTEFWVAAVVSLLTVLDGVPLPEKFEGFVLAGIAVAYTLSRGFAKSGVAQQVVVPDDTVPTA